MSPTTVLVRKIVQKINLFFEFKSVESVREYVGTRMYSYRLVLSIVDYADVIRHACGGTNNRG